VGATEYLGKAGQGVTGLFYGDPSQLIAQVIEGGACIAWNVIVGGIIFFVVGKILGSNRVEPEVEIAGLDVPEMGIPGYPEFVTHTDADAIAAAPMARAG
jgi:Amt family ammonium transporter